MSEKKSCSECSLCEGKEYPSVDGCSEPILTGWKLSAASVISFLLPIATAILGATVCGGSAAWELLGGLLGLILGIGAAFVLIRWTVRRPRKEEV